MRIAIIGAGRMGRRHIQVVQSLGLELAAVCDAAPEALALAQKENGVAAVQQFRDPRAMLEMARPECVIVATTAPTHPEFTCLAAEAGVKAILCEKPMATSIAGCDRMVAACRAHGARLAVNHQMRFMEQYTEPKRIVHSEEFGGLTSVTVIAGNFGLAMNGSHYFEMFRYLTDAPPVEATAWFSAARVPNPRGPQFEDRAGCVRLTTAAGLRFYLDASGDQGHGFQVVYAGRNGQMVVDEATGHLRLSVREAAHRGQPTTRYLMPFITTARTITPADATAPTRAVLSALLSGEDYPTGEDGGLAVRVLAAAHVSAESGSCTIGIGDARIDVRRSFPWA